MKREEWLPADGIVLEGRADEALRFEGNVLVMAGPGAGKTELLAQKACYLFQTGICDVPHRILAVSFKVDAAVNLAERVEERCGTEYGRRFASVTFDAFAKSILDRFRNALPEQYRPTHDYVINDDEVMGKIRDTICSGNKKRFRAKEAEECKLIAYGGRGNARIFLTMINNPDGERSHLSFSMVFSLALYILRHNPLVVEAIRRTFKYAFVDEFQDTTSFQYRMIETLFGGGNGTLTAVGDNKQRIMLWAGAMRDAFGRFRGDFDAERIQLLRNYRSAPKLVELQAMMYGSLGEHASPALPSDAWRPSDGEIRLVISDDDRKEAAYLAQDISNAIAAGVEPEEICILSKQKVEEYAKAIMRALDEAGIESRLEADYQTILSDPFIRLIIDCAYVALGNCSARLRRAVKDELLDLRDGSEIEDPGEFATTELELNELLDGIGSRLREAADEASLEASFQLITEWTGEEGIRTRYPAYRQSDQIGKQMCCLAKALHSMLATSPDMPSAIDRLLGKGVVPVMTIHKSKGLEYQRVYFLGLEDDAFWSFKDQPEEDRCAFFVALSRAKSSVTFTFSNYRLGTVQRHDAINEFFALLQSPGVAQVIRI
ncbi:MULTISPECIES: UvrD-helicase domain-containing protein [unclassified Adlercreutzia]|uniref:UvrD-helicase domain-containing protein n=1 Tax=unclassified Adlercreutzia TaxID=2636013 RepID=UPI0013ECA096|nr:MULTISPECIES: ATP-dependent helicase [unclassified Adlercreutzia]